VELDYILLPFWRYEKEIPFEKKYIKIDLSNSSSNNYGNLIYLINLVAQNTKSYNLIPFLLRKLFENLIYQIKLFNYFRNEELLEYHNGAIDEDSMRFLKLIRSKGNLAVHQLFHDINDEMINSWEKKTNNLLKNFFNILENVPKNEILIDDVERIETIENILNN